MTKHRLLLGAGLLAVSGLTFTVVALMILKNSAHEHVVLALQFGSTIVASWMVLSGVQRANGPKRDDSDDSDDTTS